MASTPEPFLRLPLTYDRAFGGHAWGKDFETASAGNPHGKGFVLMSNRIEGTVLPNIEKQDQLLTDPMQRPLPAGLGPLPRQSTIRLARGAIADVEEGTTRLLPGMFSMAHPRMTLDAHPARATLQVRDMTPSGGWRFRLPDLALLQASISAGAANSYPSSSIRSACFPTSPASSWWHARAHL